MTAPAAMPSREQVEAEILPMTYEGADLTECVERVLALFAPILAEKEREIEASIESHDAWATIWNDKLEAAEARALAAEAALENALDALKPFSALADSYFYRYETRPGVFRESHEDDHDERAVYGINRVEITTGHLRRARAAIAQIAAPGAAMEAQ
ncbi:hypothetical protein [Bosea sp. AS-1]|uniref:hypothetical protein n=1 Tax=Bosea sp. AS-1 TaxID=2015316 RepID=UPI000B78FCDF|nr:hypothetical protein [Bosea sp. AS-1]